jgi:hypothetical protein
MGDMLHLDRPVPLPSASGMVGTVDTVSLHLAAPARRHPDRPGACFS